MNVKSLIGETLTHIDTDGESSILLTTKSGRQIRIYHEQDCCESVSIVDTNGEWHKIIGKPLIYVGVEERPYKEAIYNGTETELVFKVDDATVISKWFGESNGYYSESVDFVEIIKR